MTEAVITGRLTASTDLLFRSSRRRGNVLESLDLIPGSTLRGAIAAAWIERFGPPGDDDDGRAFRRLFQSGEVRFQPARAVIGGEEAFPAPLTLRTDKNDPIAGEIYDLIQRSGERTSGPTDRVRADITLDGRIRSRPGPEGSLEAASGPPKIVRSRIGTFGPEDADGGDPARHPRAQAGLAADGQLFTEVRLAQGTEFIGHLRGAEDLLERLTPVLDDAGVLAVGRSRTVMGAVIAEWGPLTASTPGVIRPGDVHTLTALTDLVLLDRYQRAITVLDAEALADVIGSEVEVLSGGQQRTTTVSGWDALNHMPSHIDVAIRAGSVVRFRSGDHPALERLAQDPWIGWRNAEGHGLVAIDWPIHHNELPFRLADTEEEAAPAAHGIPEDTLARAAYALVEALAENVNLVPSLWSQVEDAVRRGEDLSAPRETTPRKSDHAQARSGRGSGSGVRRARERETLRTLLTTAFEGRDAELAGPEGQTKEVRLGWHSPLAQPDRVRLVEYMGREVRLRELQRRDARRRRQAQSISVEGQRSAG